MLDIASYLGVVPVYGNDLLCRSPNRGRSFIDNLLGISTLYSIYYRLEQTLEDNNGAYPAPRS